MATPNVHQFPMPVKFVKSQKIKGRKSLTTNHKTRKLFLTNICAVEVEHETRDSTAKMQCKVMLK